MKDRVFFFTGVERFDSSSSVVLGISEYWRDRGVDTILPTSTEDTPYIIKGDVQVDTRNRVSVRYDHSKKLQIGNGGAFDTAERRETFGGPVYNIVGNWTSSITNTAFNEFRLFWGSNKPPIICPKSGTGGPVQLTLGPPGTFAGRQYPGANFGCTIFTGLEGEENLSLIENFSYVTGQHQFKFGGQASQVRTIIDIVNFHDGRWIHPFARNSTSMIRRAGRTCHRERRRHDSEDQHLGLQLLRAGHVAGFGCAHVESGRAL